MLIILVLDFVLFYINDTAMLSVNRFSWTEDWRLVRTSQTTVDWASAMTLYGSGLLRMIMKMHCCLDSTWRTFNSSSSALLRSASLHAAGCVELKLELIHLRVATQQTSSDSHRLQVQAYWNFCITNCALSQGLLSPKSEYKIGRILPPLLFPPLPSTCRSPSFPFPFPPLPLEVGPLESSYGVWGSVPRAL